MLVAAHSDGAGARDHHASGERTKAGFEGDDDIAQNFHRSRDYLAHDVAHAFDYLRVGSPGDPNARLLNAAGSDARRLAGFANDSMQGTPCLGLSDTLDFAT